MIESQVLKLQANTGNILTNGVDFVYSTIVEDGHPEVWQEISEEDFVYLNKVVTPREFILKLMSKGITREQIENLINTNDRVWAELNYATIISRANPLLDQLCGRFGLTPADVNELFD